MYHTSLLLNVSQKKIIYDGSIVEESGSRLMIGSGVCGVGTCVYSSQKNQRLGTVLLWNLRNFTVPLLNRIYMSAAICSIS